jgi:hypothetical protein
MVCIFACNKSKSHCVFIYVGNNSNNVKSKSYSTNLSNPAGQTVPSVCLSNPSGNSLPLHQQGFSYTKASITASSFTQIIMPAKKCSQRAIRAPLLRQCFNFCWGMGTSEFPYRIYYGNVAEGKNIFRLHTKH